jgi:hypothetical protein
MLMSEDGDPRRRVPSLKKFDLSDRSIEVVADILNEQYGLFGRERAQDGIACAARRSQDAKTGANQDTRQALP